jgi:hypothetical protein
LKKFINTTTRLSTNDKSRKCGVGGDEEDDPSCTFDYYIDGKKLPIVEKAKRIAESGTIYEKKYLRSVQLFDFVHENCLVDMWIGHERFAFVDLSAGPFEWGPTIAGEGIRDRTTWPIVPTLKHKNHHFDEEHIKTAESPDAAAVSSENTNTNTNTEADSVAGCVRNSFFKTTISYFSLNYYYFYFHFFQRQKRKKTTKIKTQTQKKQIGIFSFKKWPKNTNFIV